MSTAATIIPSFFDDFYGKGLKTLGLLSSLGEEWFICISFDIFIALLFPPKLVEI